MPSGLADLFEKSGGLRLHLRQLGEGGAAWEPRGPGTGRGGPLQLPPPVPLQSLAQPLPLSLRHPARSVTARAGQDRGKKKALEFGRLDNESGGLAPPGEGNKGLRRRIGRRVTPEDQERRKGRRGFLHDPLPPPPGGNHSHPLYNPYLFLYDPWEDPAPPFVQSPPRWRKKVPTGWGLDTVGGGHSTERGRKKAL